MRRDLARPARRSGSRRRRISPLESDCGKPSDRFKGRPILGLKRMWSMGSDLFSIV
jgi:hypothetical protein